MQSVEEIKRSHPEEIENCNSIRDCKNYMEQWLSSLQNFDASIS
ncbi:hypothetical protein RchiOBHm_Chr5g0075391 [Rosa chinensis]|uniref:Uncharacterized protein n=1 Tax=Rosa chinensis TaxID=74649 RepID=A0A2P6QLF3_ROSCH|nr:hypothetical protein RchiOBHm_Chr5g0075391 [Rosa chinensis]